jgi:LPS sulfotransferase NodH
MVMSHASRLQRSNHHLSDERIIEGYRQLYDAFFEQRDLIPEGHFHEVCFEALEQDRIGQIRQLYEALDLPGFAEMKPALQRYVDSISGYHKNEYEELPPALRTRIAQAWYRNFEEWGYPC